VAKFIYIGTLTKADGTVDVRIPIGKLKGKKTFLKVKPNSDTIFITDKRGINLLRRAVGLNGEKLYQEVKEKVENK